ncbi:MAG: hypothetical protein HYS44_02695 [Candidatus Niyogibacteria bacterium]|nr:hypothetical protein [Candidatus Niyogibacteria bacterium]
MKTTALKSVVWKEGKRYVAQCLNVDVSSFGNTKKEALKNLNEALGLFFEDGRILFLTKKFIERYRPALEALAKK